MSRWLERVEVERAGAVVRRAMASDLLSATRQWVVFHDLDLMRERITELRASFPPTALHAIAIKANPLVEVLRVVVETGAGLEAASLEEVHLALAAGCAPTRIIYDSPAKTTSELEEALRLGVHVNADSLAEVERIAGLPGEIVTREASIGLRVNPLVGTGSIRDTSVAGTESKFGVRLDTHGEAMLQAFDRNPWLTGLHVHVGSQGCPLELLVDAVSRVNELRRTIAAYSGRPQVSTLDIGGGLPVAYMPYDSPPSLDQYVQALSREVPSLFSTPRLITEFGRAVQASCGWAVSRVEYVKELDQQPLAIVHFGADFLLRPVYQPLHWGHQFALLDGAGVPKVGPRSKWTVGGPLCFAGDIVARDVALPNVEPGDLLMVRDVGAYTLSMWSRHCSRGLPLVLGYRGEAEPELTVLHRGESPADVVAFWSRRPVRLAHANR